MENEDSSTCSNGTGFQDTGSYLDGKPVFFFDVFRENNNDRISAIRLTTNNNVITLGSADVDNATAVTDLTMNQ